MTQDGVEIKFKVRITCKDDKVITISRTYDSIGPARGYITHHRKSQKRMIAGWKQHMIELPDYMNRDVDYYKDRYDDIMATRVVKYEVVPYMLVDIGSNDNYNSMYKRDKRPYVFDVNEDSDVIKNSSPG